MANGTVRIGIIGAGANTRRMHLPGFQKIPGVEVVLVCNRSEESSRKVAEEFGIPGIAANWRQVVESPDVDAVMIGTWPYLHAEATVAALDAGKHVLTEARMARNLSEALTMLEASRRHPELTAQVVPAPMSLDVDSTVVAILEAGAIGDLREICVTHTGSQYFSAEAPRTWRQDVELSGYNVLTLGIYHEMIQRWIGLVPEWVFADAEVFTKWRPSKPGGEPVEVTIPDSVSVLGRFPRDIRLVYHFSGVEGGQLRNEMRLNGSKGSLRFDGSANELYQSDGSSEWKVEIPAPERRGWRVEEDFIDSIRTGAPVRLTSFEDGVKYMRFTEAVYHSWQQREKKVL